MKTTFNKTISVLLSLLMLLSVFGGAGLQAFAAEERVMFLEADGSQRWVYDPIGMNDSTYELVGGEDGTRWYVTGSYVSPNNGDYATLHHGITVRGDVSLIIRDNLHLTIEGGIYVTENGLRPKQRAKRSEPLLHRRSECGGKRQRRRHRRQGRRSRRSYRRQQRLR